LDPLFLNHFFLFFFFLVSTINGLLGSYLFGKMFSIGSAECYSLSGRQSPCDKALMFTPILFLVNFYFILVTSSNWFNLSL